MTSPAFSIGIEEATGSQIGNNFARKAQRQSKSQTKSNVLRIFTWNVKTLQKSSALSHYTYMHKQSKIADTISRYGADIIALQEVKWRGQDRKLFETYDIYYSCHETRCLFGTGFVVSHRLKNLDIDFTPLSPRLCVLRIKNFHISLINSYAPTNVAPTDDKDKFYATLDKAYYDCPRDDMKIVIGDMNAMIGRESYYKQYIGSQSLHTQTNNNGVRLINFAISKNMILGSTYFQREDKYKGTWYCLRDRTMHQIDHILIDRKYFSRLLNVKTYRCAKIGSDHSLVGAKLRVPGIPNAEKEKGKKMREETQRTENEKYDIRLLVTKQNLDYEILEDVMNSLRLVDHKNFSITDILIRWCGKAPSSATNEKDEIIRTVNVWLNMNRQGAEPANIQMIQDRNETPTEFFRPEIEELIAQIRGITTDENLIYESVLDILYDRLHHYLKDCGRSAIHQIHMLRRILENSEEYNDTIHHLFIDLNITYDRLPKPILYKTMGELKIPKKLIYLTDLIIDHFLKIWNISPRKIRKSQRKEEMLMRLLFHIVLQKVIQDANMNESIIYDETNSVQVLAYGGHIDVIARSSRQIRRFLDALKCVGLHIDLNEMTFMETGVKVKPVQEYVYLGSLVDTCIPWASRDCISNEVKRRCMLANMCYYELAEHFNNEGLHWEHKIKIYATLIIPVLVYGSETWIIYGGEEEILLSFEKRIFDIIFKSTTGIGARTFKFHLNENYLHVNICPADNIVTFLKSNRSLYAKCILECNDEGLKKVVWYSLNKSRKRGRPTATWRSEVIEQLRRQNAFPNLNRINFLTV